MNPTRPKEHAPRQRCKQQNWRSFFCKHTLTCTSTLSYNYGLRGLQTVQVLLACAHKVLARINQIPFRLALPPAEEDEEEAENEDWSWRRRKQAVKTIWSFVVWSADACFFCRSLYCFLLCVNKLTRNPSSPVLCRSRFESEPGTGSVLIWSSVLFQSLSIFSGISVNAIEMGLAFVSKKNIFKVNFYQTINF